MQKTSNLRVKTLKALITPALLTEELPLSKKLGDFVWQARQDIIKVVHGKDPRLLVIVGPCSVHDVKAAYEYATYLHKWIQAYKNELCIVMRVYFEKPRTTIGWKGLINDPDLNGSFNINKGLRLARHLLLDINQMGVPTGTEFLDTTIPQYITDLIAWSAIGARTVESQVHRELASGLSMPVGFKNSTTGDIKVAVDAVYAASFPHHFLGVSKQGVAAIVSTLGNKDCHVILRGGSKGPNFESMYVKEAAKLLSQAQVSTKIMIDCSHGNSLKDPNNQKKVVHSICKQITEGETQICGVMLESNLVFGKQDHDLNQPHQLVYGQSITDACIDVIETEKMLEELAKAVQTRKV